MLNIINSDLSNGSTFENTNLSQSKFTDVNLSGSVFTDVSLNGVSIHNVDTKNLVIDGHDFDELVAFKNKMTTLSKTLSGAHELKDNLNTSILLLDINLACIDDPSLINYCSKMNIDENIYMSIIDKDITLESKIEEIAEHLTKEK